MAQVPEKYVGREQTLVKHLFLTKYLRKAAFMVFQGRSNTFNFVDAFAGPWSLADNTDFTDSSFDQAIRTLDPVRDHLEQRGVTGRRLRFRFCEKKPDRCAQLRDYAQRQSDYDIKVYEGVFEDHADEIADDCRLGFTFTFIDPTGFKLRSADIARFLAKTRSEFLLNFMADHVNRSAGWEGVNEAYGELLDDPKWRVRYDALPENLPQEERILSLLKQRLKELRAATFMPDFEIMNPAAERVKMRLVLGTHKWHGVEVFRDVEADVERKEFALRQGRREAIDRQMCLIPEDVLAQWDQDRSGVGCRPNREMEAKVVRRLFAASPSLHFEQLVGPVLEEAAIRTTHLKDILCAMKKAGEVDFPQATARNKPKEGMIIRLVAQ